MYGQQDGAEHFADVEEVPQGRSCEIAAAAAVAISLDGPGVFYV